MGFGCSVLGETGNAGAANSRVSVGRSSLVGDRPLAYILVRDAIQRVAMVKDSVRSGRGRAGGTSDWAPVCRQAG